MDVVIVEESRFRRMGPVIIQDMLLPADVCKLLVCSEAYMCVRQLQCRVEMVEKSEARSDWQLVRTSVKLLAIHGLILKCSLFRTD